MIRLRLKRFKGTTTEPDTLQWMCPFNIEVINSGPRAGELVIIPAPPGTLVKWMDVGVQVVEKGETEDHALTMPVPQAKKEIVIAKAGDLPVMDVKDV